MSTPSRSPPRRARRACRRPDHQGHATGGASVTFGLISDTAGGNRRSVFGDHRHFHHRRPLGGFQSPIPGSMPWPAQAGPAPRGRALPIAAGRAPAAARPVPRPARGPRPGAASPQPSASSPGPRAPAARARRRTGTAIVIRAPSPDLPIIIAAASDVIQPPCDSVIRPTPSEPACGCSLIGKHRSDLA